MGVERGVGKREGKTERSYCGLGLLRVVTRIAFIEWLRGKTDVDIWHFPDMITTCVRDDRVGRHYQKAKVSQRSFTLR